MPRELTSKQRAFADAVVSGLNPSEAYRAAGYSCARMSAHSIGVEAQRLMKHPVISRVIGEGRGEAARKAVWSREEELERLSRVNDATYREITEDGSRATTTARLFTDSIDRLHAGLLEREAAESAEGKRRTELEGEITRPFLVDLGDNGMTMSKSVYELIVNVFEYFGGSDLLESIPVIEIDMRTEAEEDSEETEDERNDSADR